MTWIPQGVGHIPLKVWPMLRHIKLLQIPPVLPHPQGELFEWQPLEVQGYHCHIYGTNLK